MRGRGALPTVTQQRCGRLVGRFTVSVATTRAMSSVRYSTVRRVAWRGGRGIPSRLASGPSARTRPGSYWSSSAPLRPANTNAWNGRMRLLVVLDVVEARYCVFHNFLEYAWFEVGNVFRNTPNNGRARTSLNHARLILRSFNIQ